MKFKKISFVLLLLFVVIFTFAGCKKSKNDKKYERPKTDENQVSIYDIELTVASKNDRHIYSAKYPYHYFYVDSVDHCVRLIDMSDEIEKLNKVISRDDFNLFKDFIDEQNKLQDENPKTDGTIAYSLRVSYYDEEGESRYISCSGYDEFPKELNSIIDKFNELSKANIFQYPDEVITDFNGFVYEEFGMEDAEYTKDEVQAMLEQNEYSFFWLMGHTQDMVSNMEGYYKQLERETIEELLPTQSRTGRNVSDAEFESFLNSFAEKLGDEWSVNANGIGSVSLVDIAKTVGQRQERIYVGKTVDLENFDPEYERGILYLDAGMEGMTYTSEFMYDKSGNFFLCDFMDKDDFVAIAKAFHEAE